MKSFVCAIAVGIVTCFAASAVHAVAPEEILPDAALEARARHISAGLRCLVCQNQSIDDSDAALAKDLRVLVRERLKAGDSDDAAVEFIVQRYGDFVLLKPPFRFSTIFLWLTPLLALLCGAWLAHRSRAAGVPGAAAGGTLTDAERARVDELLKRG